MARSDGAVNLEVLWSETQRLNAAVASLQTRLAFYEGDGTAHEVVHDVVNEVAPAPQDAVDEDDWNDWPYTWLRSLRDFSRQRFHSFHRELFYRWLRWRNRRVNRRVRGSFGSCVGEDEFRLRMI